MTTPWRITAAPGVGSDAERDGGERSDVTTSSRPRATATEHAMIISCRACRVLFQCIARSLSAKDMAAKTAKGCFPNLPKASLMLVQYGCPLLGKSTGLYALYSAPSPMAPSQYGACLRGAPHRKFGSPQESTSSFLLPGKKYKNSSGK